MEVWLNADDLCQSPNADVERRVGMGSWEVDLMRVTVSMNGRKEQPEGHQELKCHFGQKRFANTKIFYRPSKSTISEMVH